MVRIQNLESLQKKLAGLKERYAKPGEELSVVVGYAAKYAIWVHERPAKHQPGKQWKFLEEPARRLSKGYLALIMRDAMRQGTSLLQALYLAGVHLQRASQQIVPVDTGNLRGSAFTAKESELQSVIASSEATLLKKMQKQGEAKVEKTAKRKVKMAVKRAKKVTAAKKAKSTKMAKKLWSKYKTMKKAKKMGRRKKP